MSSARGKQHQPRIIGDEEINEEAEIWINRTLRNGETPAAVSGFDFGLKVIAITSQRLLIAHKEDGIVLNLLYDDIQHIARDGRTLIINTKQALEIRHRFGKDQTVQELVDIAYRQKAISERHSAGTSHTGSSSAKGKGGNQQTAQTRPENGRQSHIAERVKFWEEQDRINQELIPRVIKQSEVLTGHIKNHDDLQTAAVKMVREAVEESESRINQQLQAAQEERQIAEQYLRQATEERQAAEEHLRQATEERQTQEAQWETIAEERRQHQKELQAAAEEREEMKRQHSEETAGMRRHSRRMTVIAIAAVTLAGAAVVLAVLL